MFYALLKYQEKASNCLKDKLVKSVKRVSKTQELDFLEILRFEDKYLKREK